MMNEFFIEYGFTFLFYIVLIGIIYLNRKKFEWQGEFLGVKFIGLLKTKVGLKLMDKFSIPLSKNLDLTGKILFYVFAPLTILSSLPGLVKLFSTSILNTNYALNFSLFNNVFFSTEVFFSLFLVTLISIIFFRQIKPAANLGIIVGFVGMIFIIGTLIKGLHSFFYIPDAPPTLSPIIPGAKIPGLGIKVPLVIGWIALFFVIVVHEFSHGVVARAFKMKVKSSGLVVMAILGGAFVEPDEKQLTKSSKLEQLGVFAAGPFSNILLAILALIVMAFLLNPLAGSFVNNNGVVFSQVTPGYGADDAGVKVDEVYVSLNNISFTDNQEFFNTMDSLNLSPGDEITLTNLAGEEYNVLLSEHPNNSTKGYLGVVPGVNLKELSGLENILLKVLLFIGQLFTWIFLLSLGVGLANLLPLGPVDGGRMVLLASQKIFGEESGKKVWTKITLIAILVVVILVFGPLVRFIWNFAGF